MQQHQHHARPLQVAAAAVRLSCAACSRAVALPTQNDLICPHGGRPDYGNRQRHQQRVNKVDPRLGREPEGHQAGLGLGFVRSICSTNATNTRPTSAAAAAEMATPAEGGVGWRAVDGSVIIGWSEMAFIRPILRMARWERDLPLTPIR